MGGLIPVVVLVLVASVVIGAASRSARSAGWVVTAARMTAVAAAITAAVTLIGLAKVATEWDEPLRVDAKSSVTEIWVAGTGHEPPPAAAFAERGMEFSRTAAVADVTVVLDNPGTGRRLLAIVPPLAISVLVIGGLLLVRRLLVRAAGGDPFAPDSARDLRRLAILIGVGGTVVTALEQVVVRSLADARLDHTPPSFTLPFVFPAVGVVLLGVAEIWRYGARLRDDAEGLV